MADFTTDDSTYFTFFDELIEQYKIKLENIVSSEQSYDIDIFITEFKNDLITIANNHTEQLDNQKLIDKIIYEIIFAFTKVNESLLGRMVLNDLEGIIQLNLEELENIPTMDDINMLKLLTDEIQDDDDEEDDIEKLYALLYVFQQMIECQEIIKYLIKFDLLKKIITEHIKNTSEDLRKDFEDIGLNEMATSNILNQLKYINENDYKIIFKNYKYYSVILDNK
jgi:hypothetical protein